MSHHPNLAILGFGTMGQAISAGLMVLEDGRIRSVVARGIERATQVAGGLG